METVRRIALFAALAVALCSSVGLRADGLPAQYFQLLNSGAARIESRWNADRPADLERLEASSGWKHSPSALLVAAVLYTQKHPANSRHGDPKLLALAEQLGGLLVREHAQGRYSARLDHHRDTYMWVDAYRLLERQLGDESRAAWQKALRELLQNLAAEVAEKRDFPWYQSPFISTSPNHLSLWASTVYLGGKVFRERDWEELGERVLHRFATEDQAPDGYWGEHSRSGPTTGYDYLTATAVALYYEHSRDPAALQALRRSTDFHKFFTYPDGTPVETVNDRNRYWSVSPWGHFGFSHFADGRRYAEFLTGFISTNSFNLETLGRLAQNALYFHRGRTAPIPQDQPRYQHQMSVPAGMRKSGPWVTCLSGLIATPTTSRWYLDRQGHFSVFHEKLGLIITGANSKNQPDLATFTETSGGKLVHLPTSSRLLMAGSADRLALAYNSFFAVLEVPSATDRRLDFRFVITPTGRIASANLNLQLVLKAGEDVETAAGQKVKLEDKPIQWKSDALGKWIRHRGWTLHLPSGARLSWPIYPFNPYRNGLEADLTHAVGVLSIPLTGKQDLGLAVEAGLIP